MGWSFGWNSKEQLINYLIENYGNCETISHTIVGKELWILVNRQGIKDISVCVLDKQKDDWGYSSFSVSCYPYYYNCPKKYVLQVSFNTEGSKEWLRQWELRHSKEAKENKEVWKQLKEGDKFLRMIGQSSEECIFIREYSKQSIVYKTLLGQVYRCKKNCVALIKELV